MTGKERVYVGVSGGIDSAAAILLLKKQGYDVVGVYIDMLGEINSDIEILRSRLDVEIIIVNAQKELKEKVINPFVSAYINGETPSPCSECNPLLKWAILIETADKLYGKSAKVATGHYARVVERNSKLYIAKGKDELKNQSYYLWKLPQSTLKRAIFPLGSYLKSELKAMMDDLGFDFMVKKRESMGVCFLKGASYQQFLLNQAPELKNLANGEVLDKNNNVIGHHEGYPFYTLAQRKGLNIEKGKCVIRIDKNSNKLYIGEPNELKTDILHIKNLLTVDRNEFFNSDNLTINVRGIGENPKGYCKVIAQDENNDIFRVELLDDYAWAITPGQPVVFYIDDIVVGGAICY